MLSHEKEWIRKVTIHEEHDVVFVAVQLSVYGFSLVDGARLFSWEDLHAQHVTHVRMLLCVNDSRCVHCSRTAPITTMHRL